MLVEHCNNDWVMFVRYVSFNMRINNKKIELNWNPLRLACTIDCMFILSRFQSLDRRKRVQDGRHRANSTGALNFGYLAEEGIVRGSVGLFNYSSNRDRFASSRFAARESQQSIGQFSDHVDKYRDVALWTNLKDSKVTCLIPIF